MKKPYANRRMQTDDTGEVDIFFFPKHNPPISIAARTRKEAEQKLATLDNKKEI